MCAASTLLARAVSPPATASSSPGKVEGLKELAQLAQDRPVVLLYGARDEKHNEAVVLEEVLEEGIRNS